MVIHIITNIYRNIETGQYIERWVAGHTFQEACNIAILKAEEDEETRKIILVERLYASKDIDKTTKGFDEVWKNLQ